jgi:hypothetical protein
MSQGSSKALKAKVVYRELEEESDLPNDEDNPKLSPEEFDDVEYEYMALSHQIFMNNTARAKAYLQERASSKYAKGGTQKLRTCFNCSSKLHFIANVLMSQERRMMGDLFAKKYPSTLPRSHSSTRSFPTRSQIQELFLLLMKNILPMMMMKKKNPQVKWPLLPLPLPLLHHYLNPPMRTPLLETPSASWLS